MNQESSLSLHEQLHALADGQLDARQTNQLLALLEHSADLQKQLCEIQRLKHQVRSAYPLPNHPSQRRPFRHSQRWQRAASYVLAVTLAFLAGIGSHAYLDRPPEGLALDSDTAYDNRFIVFLDSHEATRMEQALHKAENLASQVESSGGSVYVVTSAEGIDLLRLGTTRHESRIVHMSQTYPHLRFVACSNTLYAFKQRGELVELVDKAEVAPSAVEFVVQHMRQGWRYIAI